MPAMASTSGNVTTSPAAQTVTTSFLLTNLHCPTCVSTIKAILQESTDGQIRWVSPNIVTSVVTVEHHPAASIRQMQSALEDNGFEVCAIATPSGHVSDLDLGTMQRDHQGASRAGPSKANARSAEPSALSRWILASRKLAGQPEKVQAHLRNCAHCRGSPEEGCGNNMQQTGVTSHLGLASTRTSTTSDSQPGTLSKSFIAIETSENVPLWRATVAVGGMTCAACSRKVTEQLQKHDWISNVNVSLISNSATVDLIDKDKEADLIDLIEELGYEATLVTIENVNKTKRKRREGSDTWRATLSIGGMTCAACSNKIIEQMKKKEWVKDITVNLISNTATVDFQGYNNASRLVEAIEELGYDAASDTVVSLDDDDEEAPEEQQRTIEIKIDGLYCLHCPARVVQSLAGFRRQLTVVSEPTLQKPIMKITYVPDAPSFTIRQILSAIDASDPDFTASLYHPPTLEERSKMMQRRHYRQILWRFIFSGIIAIPTFVIGIVYMNLVPMSQKHFLMETPGSSRIDRMQIALFVLATPVYFFSADVFHRRAFTEIRTLWRRGSRVPILQRFVRFGSMNTLMSLGTTISYFASVGQMIAIAVDDSRKLDDSLFYFDSVVFLTFFLLLGRLLEALSKSKMGNAVEKLANLRPTRAILVKGHGTEKQQDEVVDTDLLDRGDIVRVPHGSSPPSDGIIVEGNSSFDESSLTGESVPVKKTTGDEVFSGTVNKENSVLVRITGTSGKSLLDQIVEIVREGQTKRAPIEQVADSMTAYFVPCITLAAILTWIGWLCAGYSGGVPTEWLNQTQSGEWVAFAIQFSIAVFVVACPCGLGLAAPTAIYVGSSLAAKHGILAKGGGEAFQLASTVDCVVFDKTGTLTQGGEPSITDSEVYAASDDEEKGILAALKAVEGNSSHPIAKAIVSFCTATGKEELPNVTIDSTQEIPGKGMRAAFKETVAGQPLELIVGNEALMEDFSVQVPEATSQLLQKWKQEAKSVALVAIKKAAAVAETEAAPAPTWSLAAILAISDPIRPEASLVIRALQERGVQVWMLSGDNQITANAVAQQLGIPPEQVIAGVLPTGKAEQITYLQSTLKTGRGKSQESTTQRAKVAMVGDGINDSPALTKADVGIAIGSGSDVAMNSAAFVLMNSDLKAVVRLLDLSKTILRRVRFNFGWAVVYNTIAIPFAAGAFYPIKANGNHIKLDPAWAALAMALSSVSVVVSSLLLKTKIFGYRERKLE